MSNKIIATLIIVPILLVAGVYVATTQNKSDNTSQPPAVQNDTKTASQAQNEKTDKEKSASQDKGTTKDNNATPNSDELPIPQNDQTVIDINKKFSDDLIRYTFDGTIKSITPTGQEVRLTALNWGTNLPPLNVTKSVRVSKQSGSSFVPATMADLNANQKVNFTFDYSKSGKFWIFRDVFILQ